MGENNTITITQMKTTRYNINEEEASVQTQTTKTELIDHTTPRISGDLRYLINKGNNRNTQFIYQYNDNRDQTIRQ